MHHSLAMGAKIGLRLESCSINKIIRPGLHKKHVTNGWSLTKRFFSSAPSSPSSSSIQMHMQMQILQKNNQFHHFHSSSIQMFPPVPPSSSPFSSSSSVSPSSPPITSPADVTPILIGTYADKPTTSVTLRQMFQFGYHPGPAILLASAQFLHKEMPIRLAKRIRDLEDLPFGLTQTQELQEIIIKYKESFVDCISFPYPLTSDDELRYSSLLSRILDRHADIVPKLARGLSSSWIARGSINFKQKQHYLLQEFLDRFNISRIGVRLLMAQHIALHTPMEGYVGVIHGRCRPVSIINEALHDARQLCIRHFGVCPNVTIEEKPLDMEFRYVPIFLRYMVHELLKNSMRAVVEFHSINGVPASDSSDLPPINIVVIEGDSDIVIKVSDRGGGIARADLPSLFTYTYQATNYAKKINNDANSSTNNQNNNASNNPSICSTNGASGAIISAAGPMFGDSFGLPLTRLFARYLGGDLSIVSMHGYGTDAFLYLNKLGNSDEPLPE